MRSVLNTKRLAAVSGHLNLAAGLIAALLTANVLMAAALLFKTEKTVIVPPDLKQSYHIGEDTFSPEYLEEMGGFFLHLLLDVSPDNILYNTDIILRYTHSTAHGDLRRKMLEAHEKLKSENVCTVFQPTEAAVCPKGMSVDFTGTFSQYMAGKRIKDELRTYRVTFSGRKGRLFLTGFERIEEQ